MSLDVWSEGWEKWIDPETLTESDSIIISETDLKRQLKRAIINEDYELAAKLRDKISNVSTSN